MSPAYTIARVRGRAPHVVPVRPVQVEGAHVWNYLLFRHGLADDDRVKAA